MNSENPYVAPRVEAVIQAKLRNFQEFDDKEFKKLYSRSSNVSAITALIFLGMLINVGLTFLPDFSTGIVRNIFYAVAFVQLVALIGLGLRTSWGRIMGIICCCLMTLNIPIGTLIGIAGLFAFIKAPELFGPDKISHKELKADFDRRKKEKKAAKKQAKLDKKAAKKQSV